MALVLALAVAVVQAVALRDGTVCAPWEACVAHEDAPAEGPACECGCSESCSCCVEQPTRPAPTPPTRPWRADSTWIPELTLDRPAAPAWGWAMARTPGTGVRALGRDMARPEQRCVWRT